MSGHPALGSSWVPCVHPAAQPMTLATPTPFGPGDLAVIIIASLAVWAVWLTLVASL